MRFIHFPIFLTVSWQSSHHFQWYLLNFLNYLHMPENVTLSSTGIMWQPLLICSHCQADQRCCAGCWPHTEMFWWGVCVWGFSCFYYRSHFQLIYFFILSSSIALYSSAYCLKRWSHSLQNQKYYVLITNLFIH